MSESHVNTEIDGLADGIAVGAVALGVDEVVEFIPSDEVVGIATLEIAHMNTDNHYEHIRPFP